MDIGSIPKHGDERGFLIEFLREDEKFMNFKGQIYASTIAPGTIRGNHFHEHKTEVFAVMRGKMKVFIQHRDGGDIKEYEIDGYGENIERIIVEPNYAHTFINTGDEEVVLLAWGDQVHDHSGPDQYQHDIKV
jgi:dTDP-4-dehydrorhamnose 3,5-epimerase-like enzyme